MARDFTPSDIIETTAGGATLAAFPMSFFSRFWEDVAAQHRLVTQVKHTANTDLATLFTFDDGGNQRTRVFLFSDGGAGPGDGAAASPSNSHSLNAWNTAFATFTSSELEIITNGDFANRGTVATTAVIDDMTRICYGAERRSTSTIAAPLNGRLAESGVLNVLATEDEMRAFQAGYHAYQIWPLENIHHYRNFIREIDDPPIGAALTDSGTSVIEHPPETMGPGQAVQRLRKFTPLPHLISGRGKSQLINTWSIAARGRTKTAIDTFDISLRGNSITRNTHNLALRGSNRIQAAFEFAARGRHVISTLVGATFLMSLRGGHVVQAERLIKIAARHRIANAAINLFELFIGIDAEPDLTGTPDETFAALPHTTAALVPGAGNRTFFFVLRFRNQYNLSSQNILSWNFTMDNAGVEVVTPPTGPEVQAVEPASAGNVRVTADYLYQVDGVNQADTWAVFLTSDGSTPDPSVDVPIGTPPMVKVDGVAKLDTEFGPFADGLTIKVVVTTRRGSIQSTNTAVVQTIADTDGPPKPVGVIHIGDRSTIVSTEGDNN